MAAAQIYLAGKATTGAEPSPSPCGPVVLDPQISTSAAASAPDSRRTLVAIGYSVAAFVSFSCGDAAMKWLSQRYSVLQLIFVASIFGLVLMAGLVRRTGGFRAARPRRTGLVLLRAGLLAANAVLGFTALKLLPLADGYTVFFTGPMMITALSVPLLGEPVGWRRWSAVMVGFLGVLVILRPGGQALNLGHLAAISATAFYALSVIVLRRMGDDEPNGGLLLTQMLALLAATAPTLPYVYLQPSLPDLALNAMAGVFSGLGQIGLLKAYRTAAPAVVAPFQYTQIIWAGVFGYVVFDQLPTRWTLLGSVIIIASGLYILWRETVVGRGRPADRR
jgi:S-adenosylmethionine uptake transporter